ncbi:MAG: pantetheine-phosphate adenylyltransferase [Actinomycetota bacterium]|nr:pantetheine-phosphate adenylyltransferase [Actinomycetota bacterium]MDQ3680984.1 pantetheine-phosphate adenylyltransferase [Actinomycetota bacterium]
MRTALFPGSFDPLHDGHLEVIETASKLFDSVIVAALSNPQKGEPLFGLEERQEMIRESVAHLDNVKVASFASLVVDLAREVGADVIVKGLRAASDFDYELQMAQMNEAISGVVTVFLPSASSRSFIASSLVRQMARLGGATRVSSMVPSPVAKRLQDRFTQ